MIQVPALGGREILDGASFTVTYDPDGAGIGIPPTIVTFEFDSNGSTTVTNPDQVIRYALSDTPDDLAQKIKKAIEDTATNDPTLDVELQPTNMGGGLVHLGSTKVNTLTLNTAAIASNLVQLGTPGGIEDEERFTIGNGFISRVFEFDDGDGVTDPAYVPIVFSQIQTHNDIGDTIKTVIENQPLGLTPTYLGDGQVHLGGDDGLPAGGTTLRHTLSVTPAEAPHISYVRNARPRQLLGSPDQRDCTRGDDHR